MTIFTELQNLVADFVSRRNWDSYHNPKNLSMALAIEAAELMELFQWDTIDECRTKLKDDTHMMKVGYELADVLIYALSFANSTGIDIEHVIRKKLQLNEERFPPTK